MRRLLALWIVAGLALPTVMAQDKEKKETPAKELFAKIAAEIKESMQKKDREGYTKAIKGGFDKLIKKAEENPKAADAVEYALEAEKLVGGGDQESAARSTRLVKLLEDHLFADPRIAPILLSNGHDEPKLMAKVLKDNKDAACVAVAHFRLGTDAVRRNEESGKKEDADEAVKQFKLVGKDVKLQMGPGGDYDLGKEVEGMLFQLETLGIGKAMPELKSKDLDGKEVKLSDLKGKVVVLDVWATWCPPCRAMIPHERELVEKLKDKPFALVSVSGDDEVKTLKDFLEKEKMPWVHWFDGQDGEVMKKLRIEAFPTIFVLDAKGTIRFKGVREKKMDEAVETLLKEIEKK